MRVGAVVDSSQVSDKRMFMHDHAKPCVLVQNAIFANMSPLLYPYSRRTDHSASDCENWSLSTIASFLLWIVRRTIQTDRLDN